VTPAIGRLDASNDNDMLRLRGEVEPLPVSRRQVAELRRRLQNC
jgi:DNA-binding LytR/AlgR family response regulator